MTAAYGDGMHKALDADDIPARIRTSVSKVSDTAAVVIWGRHIVTAGEAIGSPMVTK